MEIIKIVRAEEASFFEASAKHYTRLMKSSRGQVANSRGQKVAFPPSRGRGGQRERGKKEDKGGETEKREPV